MNDAPVHAHIEELLAADALDGLDESGRRELELALAGHDPGCAECAELRAAFAEVAASMAMSLDPSPPSRGAEDRLIAAARAVRPPTGTAELRSAPTTETAPVRLAARRRPLRVVAIAVGAAACLLAAGLVGYSLHETSPSDQAIAAFTAHGGVRSTELSKGSTSMKLYYRPGQRAALVVGSGFAEPPPGHVYELWYMPVGSTQVAPAGIFTPANGSVVAPASVGPGFTAVAVSLEPGYRLSPTGPVVLSGTVPPAS